MKRISIITIIDNNNFGTFLQAFALCKTIELLGHKPELVDYCRPHMRTLTAWWNMCLQIKNPLRIAARTWNYVRSYLTHKKDKLFISQYLSPKTCYSVEEIEKNIEIADVYMTGSDQVWNSIYNKGIDKAYFLDYAPDGAKKVAYAASIGMKEISNSEQEEMKRLLDRYAMITLREDSSIKLLSDLGIDKAKLRAVLDPTLLLKKDEWRKYIRIPKLHKEKYLLVYSVETKSQDEIIKIVAKKIAKELNLKIVGVYYGNSNNRMECCDFNHYYATPDIFLTLMYYADFTVVSSFHGTAFSINFEKNFFTIMPDRFNSRVNNILTLTGLSDRLIKSKEDTNRCTATPISWEHVDNILKHNIEYSKLLISNMIQ